MKDLLTEMLAVALQYHIDVDFTKWHSSAQIYVVTTRETNLNVRDYPDFDGKVITSLAPGTRVLLLEINGEWGFVQHAGGMGWVSLTWLKKV